MKSPSSTRSDRGRGTCPSPFFMLKSFIRRRLPLGKTGRLGPD
jgi:hypothetical protein